jgi:hypothetical protein
MRARLDRFIFLAVSIARQHRADFERPAPSNLNAYAERFVKAIKESCFLIYWMLTQGSNSLIQEEVRGTRRCNAKDAGRSG